MSKVEIKIDSSGVRKNILQADWMLEYVRQKAEARADSDSHVKSFMGYDRAHAIVYPNTKETKS